MPGWVALLRRGCASASAGNRNDAGAAHQRLVRKRSTHCCPPPPHHPAFAHALTANTLLPAAVELREPCNFSPMPNVIWGKTNALQQQMPQVKRCSWSPFFRVALSLLLLTSAAAETTFRPLPTTDFPSYEYAKQFTPEELLGNQSSRDAFMSLMFAFEGRFHSDGVGVDMASGMTFDGTAIHPDTLLPQALAHPSSTPHVSFRFACFDFPLTHKRPAVQRPPQLQRRE